MNSSIIIHSEISKYPSITKDLSFSISKQQNFYAIKQKILESSNLLKTVSFFDIYFDDNVLNTINIGIHLEFQSKIETLTTEKIETEIMKIRTVLINNFFVEFKD
jgi:phenylalanyl-tRNA synthetase beta chain